MGGRGQRTCKSTRPYLKSQLKEKGWGCVAQAVKYKHEALNLILNTATKKRKEKIVIISAPYIEFYADFMTIGATCVP